MASYPDSSPNAAAKSKGGMKNDDGREKGNVSKPAFDDKKVDSMPNEGAPRLPQINGDIV